MMNKVADKSQQVKRNYTALPWRVRDRFDESGRVVAEVMSGGKDLSLYKIVHDGKAEGSAEVDAEFIALAVNCHTSLLEALTLALEHENHKDGECGCCWTVKARAAITKAEVRTP